MAEPFVSPAAPSVTPNYGYSSDGMRAWKSVGGSTTYFLYDGSNPVCELDGTGAVTATNTWGGTLLSRRVAAASVFYTFDPQGNVAQRLDSTGGVLGTYAFDAFGLRTGTDATTDPYSGFGGGWGYYADAETGLSLLGHRYYDTGTGRFVTRDPLGYAGGSDLYAYCGNNPVMGADPSGFCDEAGSEYGDGNSGQWPDRLKAWADGNIPSGPSIPGLFNNPLDMLKGLLGGPSNIEHLGSPSGQHFGDPANYGWGGVGKDATTFVTVAMAGMGAAAGARASNPSTLYRIITKDDPLETLSSNAALGKAPRGPEINDPSIHDSISTWDSLESAQRTALKLKNVQGYAELQIPGDAPGVSIRQTFGQGHYSVSGDASQLLNYWGRSILK